MLDLPVDIQLLVSEYITSKEDLKALCLTCKSLRTLAIPLLYHAVHLRTWERDDINRFVRSVAAGAGLHLRHTRILTFEDTQAPREPSTLQTGPFMTTGPFAETTKHLFVMERCLWFSRCFRLTVSTPSGKHVLLQFTKSLLKLQL